MPEQAGRLALGVIGSGRVGPVLAAALAGAGHHLAGMSAESDSSRERINAILPNAPVLDVAGVVQRADLVLICVPDDQLIGLVEGLARLGHWRPGQIVAHTSAVHGLAALDAATSAGALAVTLHPMINFTGTSLDVQRLHGSYIAVSATPALLPIAQALAVELGGEPLVIFEPDRAAFAEATQQARGFVAYAVEQAADRLAAIGVTNPGRVLGALVRSAVDNALATRAGNDPELEGLGYSTRLGLWAPDSDAQNAGTWPIDGKGH